MHIRVLKSIKVCSPILLLLVGCGPQKQLDKAIKLEKKGEYYKAWKTYQTVAAKNPKKEVAPEALFRAGWVAEKRLGDCFMAKTFYSQVVERYPHSRPWARAAALQNRNCPDYFPLINGTRWVMGDSDSKGKNARIVMEVKPVAGGQKKLPSEVGRIVRSYYAGEKRSQTTRYIYKKKEKELLEFTSESDPRAETILMWPLEEGTSWKTKKNKRLFQYRILKTDAKVKVAAGNFNNCIKVQSYIVGVKGAVTNEYYAPGVGLVLTTVPTKSGEKRLTELLSYEMADVLEFNMEEKEES